MNVVHMGCTKGIRIPRPKSLTPCVTVASGVGGEFRCGSPSSSLTTHPYCHVSRGDTRGEEKVGEVISSRTKTFCLLSSHICEIPRRVRSHCFSPIELANQMSNGLLAWWDCKQRPTQDVYYKLAEVEQFSPTNYKLAEVDQLPPTN